MRADPVGQRMGTEALYDGAASVAARFNGAKGAAPVAIDGDLGGAWFMRGTVKVAFVFHVEAGRVREIELIADPEILATLHITRRRLPRRPRATRARFGHSPSRVPERIRRSGRAGPAQLGR